MLSETRLLSQIQNRSYFGLEYLIALETNCSLPVTQKPVIKHEVEDIDMIDSAMKFTICY